MGKRKKGRKEETKKGEGGTRFSIDLLFKLSKPQIKKRRGGEEGVKWETGRTRRRRILTNLLFKLSQPPTLSRPRKSKQEDPPTMIRT